MAGHAADRRDLRRDRRLRLRGDRKPEPRIYELTLDALGVAPEAALLIDDLAENCQAARELGMRAVWFQIH